MKDVEVAGNMFTGGNWCRSVPPFVCETEEVKLLFSGHFLF